jgi:hypothetical protein
MTSPRRRRGRPVESVVLRITFSGSKAEAKRIKEAIPAATMRDGVCEVAIEADEPSDVARKARELLEKLRSLA